MKFTSAGGVPLTTDGKGPTVIVKDGTVSSRQEQHLKATEADAERRRSHQDMQQRMSQQGVGGGGVARLGSRRLLTEDSPRLILTYRKWNDQQCEAEITMVNRPASEGGGLDTMFTLVCPKCLQRGVPQGQAQLQVRNSHRSFDIDQRKAGPVRVYAGTLQYIRYVHGTVTVNDTVRCSNTGCGWGAKVIDSVVDDV